MRGGLDRTVFGYVLRRPTRTHARTYQTAYISESESEKEQSVRLIWLVCGDAVFMSFDVYYELITHAHVPAQIDTINGW